MERAGADDRASHGAAAAASGRPFQLVRARRSADRDAVRRSGVGPAAVSRGAGRAGGGGRRDRPACASVPVGGGRLDQRLRRSSVGAALHPGGGGGLRRRARQAGHALPLRRPLDEQRRDGRAGAARHQSRPLPRAGLAARRRHGGGGAEQRRAAGPAARAALAISALAPQLQKAAILRSPAQHLGAADYDRRDLQGLAGGANPAEPRPAAGMDRPHSGERRRHDGQRRALGRPGESASAGGVRGEPGAARTAPTA